MDSARGLYKWFIEQGDRFKLTQPPTREQHEEELARQLERQEQATLKRVAKDCEESEHNNNLGYLRIAKTFVKGNLNFESPRLKNLKELHPELVRCQYITRCLIRWMAFQFNMEWDMSYLSSLLSADEQGKEIVQKWIGWFQSFNLQDGTMNDFMSATPQVRRKMIKVKEKTLQTYGSTCLQLLSYYNGLSFLFDKEKDQVIVKLDSQANLDKETSEEFHNYFFVSDEVETGQKDGNLKGKHLECLRAINKVDDAAIWDRQIKLCGQLAMEKQQAVKIRVFAEARAYDIYAKTLLLSLTSRVCNNLGSDNSNAAVAEGILKKLPVKSTWASEINKDQDDFSTYLDKTEYKWTMEDKKIKK